MNLPNKLTVLRIILAGVFMLFLFMHGVLFKMLALLTFLLASLTDLLDGYIAKKYNMVTDFGKLMDPIADKILVLSAFLAFVQMELIPAWMALIIIFREIVITGLRIAALTQGKVLAAEYGGKHKMVSQVASIFVILLFLIFREAGTKLFDGSVIFILMLITTFLTLGSGISYLIKNRGVYFASRNF
jgi:CDP-diacylglycerol--glycerol-3-phosphate 3-phosphatidyltransferase